MRSIWRGSISFGLVNIPVRIYSASRERELSFKLLHKKDHSEIRYARICKEEGKEIPWAEIVKGYEYKKGDYVIMDDEDFERANVKKTKTIDIIDFTEEAEIDTKYYATPYYLEPDKGAAKAYNLLRESLKKSKKVAIGKFVFKNHEHIGVIKPDDDYLILNQLRYDSELVRPTLNVPKGETLTKKEIDMALQLIDSLTKPFKPEEYSDTYSDEVKKIIAQKAKGVKPKVKTGEVVKSHKVHDIMSLLKESLEKGKKKPTKRKRSA